MKEKISGLSDKLAKEWHPTKNINLDIKKMKVKSRFRPWWLCSTCQHEWEAPIYHRSNGTGCPQCFKKNLWNKRSKSILKTSGTLADQHPHLVKEWHPTKNGQITPYDVTAGSGKKMWWKCSKGEDHEWISIISNRVKGRGCPVCSGRKAVLSNSLATLHPTLAKEWHPIKNKDLFPTQVTFSSHKKIWWVCEKGHEWSVAISNRTSGERYSECPTCLKADIGQRRVKSLIKRDGSLAELAPLIAEQWHPLKNGSYTPNDFTVGSGHRAWWICDKGHEWQVAINARKGYGCPKCTYQTSQLELRLYCELNGVFSNVSWREKVSGHECDIILHDQKIAFEVDGFPWHSNREEQDKSKGFEIESTGLTLIRIRDSRLTQINHNDISYKNKESRLSIIKKAFNYLLNNCDLKKTESSLLINFLSDNKFHYDFEFQKMLSETWRVPIEKSIFKLYPKLIEEWDYDKNGYLLPQNFSPGSNVKIHWKCSKNHVWESIISARTSGGECPYCQGKRACEDNSLFDFHPELCIEWHPTKNGNLTPKDVTFGSSKDVYWLCKCGYSWKTSINNRVRSKNLGCIKCYNKEKRGKSQINKAVEKKGSFQAKFPKLAKEWHPTKNESLKPSMLSCGSSIPVWWKCKEDEDHEWKNSIVGRITHPTCPYCCGKKVGKTNSLGFLFPELAKEWHPVKNKELTPFDFTKFSGSKVWWKCKNAHEWQATIHSRAQGRGCAFCSGKLATETHNLSYLHHELCLDWDYEKNSPHVPENFLPKSNKKMWWICKKNSEHKWQATINSRTTGNGCPYCAGKKTCSSYSLALMNPKLASDWNHEKNIGLLPENFTPNSGKKVWWKCQNGHEWEASINNRSRGRGCRLCRGKNKY